MRQSRTIWNCFEPTLFSFDRILRSLVNRSRRDRLINLPQKTIMRVTFSADTSKFGVAIERAIANKSKILDEFGKATIKRTQQDIIAEQSPDGKRFAPLKASTLARKRKLGYILAILRATDAMLDAFTSEVSGDEVSITQPKDYGRVLQEGRSNMPARPFLGFTNKDAKVLIQLFLQEVRR